MESLQRIAGTVAGFWNGLFPEQPLGGVLAGLAVLVGAWLVRRRLVDLLLAIARRFRRHESDGLFLQFLEAASRPLRLREWVEEASVPAEAHPPRDQLNSTLAMFGPSRGMAQDGA